MRNGHALAVGAHPRRRGEHIFCWWKRAITVGSSPQARGTQLEEKNLTDNARLIPAGAGNTSYSSCGRYAPRAHPRRRGEHLHRLTDHIQRSGLIPAGAGNTIGPPHVVATARAHPRRRGEHFKLASISFLPAGSSPQARGTLTPPLDQQSAGGLIPAGAGNTSPSPKHSKTPKAHPRRRGEHGHPVAYYAVAKGSSPQARGTPTDFVPCVCAASAHPRRRGEHYSPRCQRR